MKPTAVRAPFVVNVTENKFVSELLLIGVFDRIEQRGQCLPDAQTCWVEPQGLRDIMMCSVLLANTISSCAEHMMSGFSRRSIRRHPRRSDVLFTKE
jgi:hypothetical protein